MAVKYICVVSIKTGLVSSAILERWVSGYFVAAQRGLRQVRALNFHLRCREIPYRLALISNQIYTFALLRRVSEEICLRTLVSLLLFSVFLLNGKLPTCGEWIKLHGDYDFRLTNSGFQGKKELLQLLVLDFDYYIPSWTSRYNAGDMHESIT